MAQTQNDYVAAIDLGTTKVVALVAKRNEEGKLQILGLSQTESLGIKKGMVVNIEDTVNAIKTTVSDVKQKTGIDFDHVYVGIAGQHIRSIRSRRGVSIDSPDHEVCAEDVKELIADMHNVTVEPGEMVLHVLPNTFWIDDKVAEKPVGMMGRQLDGEFKIVLGRHEAVVIIERCIERAGLKMNDIILEPLASAKSVLTEEEKNAGVALIDIGGGTSDLIIYRNGRVCHTAVIPFGGDSIDKDIMEVCNVLLSQARELKEKYGCAIADVDEDVTYSIPGINGRSPRTISASTLSTIIQARMKEILDFVQYQIEVARCANSLGVGVVITGGGALLRHMSHLTHFVLGQEVRIGLPGDYFLDDAQKYNKPQYSTVLGLAQMALDGEAAKTVYPNSEVIAQVETKETVSTIDSEEDVPISALGIKRRFQGIKAALEGMFITNGPDNDDMI